METFTESFRLVSRPVAFGLAVLATSLLFTSTSLPKLPQGKVYQVWVLSARDAPFSAGLLVPNDAGAATVIYPTPADIPPPTGVAVSLEREEAAAPTASAIILIGDLR